MRIECLTTFLDGKDRFEKGDVRTVDDASARRFIDAGWAREPGAPTADVPMGVGAVSLDTHDSVIGVEG